jgi:hypothetical protein
VRRVTKQPWFGPKRLIGWGWTVRSWQGAVVSVVFVGLLVLALTTISGPPRFATAAVVMLAFLAVVVLTGDPPGGPGTGKR